MVNGKWQFCFFVFFFILVNGNLGVRTEPRRHSPSTAPPWTHPHYTVFSHCFALWASAGKFRISLAVRRWKSLAVRRQEDFFSPWLCVSVLGCASAGVFCMLDFGRFLIDVWSIFDWFLVDFWYIVHRFFIPFQGSKNKRLNIKKQKIKTAKYKTVSC